ncbi:MAG: hypothetical protein LBQ68_09965, partial [Clostridiales bacterium]|nr:hypothetical protein [Clostridiales bacterium]
MKRKLSLLLAVVLSISAITFTPVNTMAATSNIVDNVQTVPTDTLLFESGFISRTTGLRPNAVLDYLMPNPHKTGDEPEWYADGTDLVLSLDDRALSGQNRPSYGLQFSLTLSNANWFFRNADGASTTTTGLEALRTTSDPNNYINGNAAFPATAPVANKDFDGLGFYLSTPTPTLPAPDALSITYDITKGIYMPGNGRTDSDYGDYYRSPGLTGKNGSLGVAYKLSVSQNNSSRATVTILQDTASLGSNLEIRIPLVSRTINDDVDCIVEVEGGSQSYISSQKLRFATARKNQTNTTIKSVVTARDEFDLDDLIISELRPGAIRANEIIRLKLPRGYRFMDTWTNRASGVDFLTVGVEPGLAWDSSGRTGLGVYDTAAVNTSTGLITNLTRNDNGNITMYNESTGRDEKYSYAFTAGTDYFVYMPNGNYTADKLGNSAYSNDDEEIWIILSPSFRASSQLRGSIYIQNLKIWADEEAQMPESGKSIEVTMDIDGLNDITEQTIVVANRVDWDLVLKTTGDIPLLISGRYSGENWDGTDADDTALAAHCVLQENTANSWWATRTTVLSLHAHQKAGRCSRRRVCCYG